ncbi:DUF4212 domain-containing protein [Aquaspirillum serpens]|uniref:DUF4212 domain-containing protein n=1 Tax=Aquaspirillum serpens TaxID=190 RepID=UPI001FE202A3|nr:DUF4212 domain-containing protein [Aquaspirillum serpens]
MFFDEDRETHSRDVLVRTGQQKQFHEEIETMSSIKKDATAQQNADAYWKDTLKLLWIVLALWAVVSYFAGIFFASALNNIYLAGYPLGFWFAQQGSIYAFVVLIFWYAKQMGKIDEKHDVHED